MSGPALDDLPTVAPTEASVVLTREVALSPATVFFCYHVVLLV